MIFNKFNLLFDKRYAKNRYFKTFGKTLNLDNPKTFNEKIQWLKLYRRDELQTLLCDKYLVRDYLKSIIGDKYLNQLYGVYENADQIDYESLPTRFVLKCNHGSGWNILCKDKSELNNSDTNKQLNHWLNQNYYHLGKEWCYKNIKPLIIAEEYLGDNLDDYKIFCFNGKAKYIQIDKDRFTNHTRCFYDLSWIKQPFTTQYPIYKEKVKKPPLLSEMISIAEELAGDLEFARIDLYQIKKSIRFGEITLYHGNGFEKFVPEKYDLVLGHQLKLMTK